MPSVYYIFDNAKGTFVPVAAKRITIPGWEEYDFFIHYLMPPQSPGWSISEATTGMAIGSLCRLRKEVITDATARLERAGKAELNRLIEWACSKHTSPWVRNKG